MDCCDLVLFAYPFNEQTIEEGKWHIHIVTINDAENYHTNNKWKQCDAPILKILSCNVDVNNTAKSIISYPNEAFECAPD